MRTDDSKTTPPGGLDMALDMLTIGLIVAVVVACMGLPEVL